MTIVIIVHIQGGHGLPPRPHAVPEIAGAMKIPLLADNAAQPITFVGDVHHIAQRPPPPVLAVHVAFFVLLRFDLDTHLLRRLLIQLHVGEEGLKPFDGGGVVYGRAHFSTLRIRFFCTGTGFGFLVSDTRRSV